MIYSGPFNHQAIFENDVWNIFDALGKGWRAYRMERKDRPIQVMPSGAGAWLFYDDDRIRPLIEQGLMQRKEDQLVINSTERYELTAEGKALYDELSSLENFEAVFIDRIKPKKQ